MDSSHSDKNSLEIHEVESSNLSDASADLKLTKAISRKLVRKADLYILTFLSLFYAIQFMDKVCVSLGAVMGLQEDLGMKGSMYSWVGSSVYLGYLVFELPLDYALQKFPIAKTTAVCMAIWGVVLTCSGASQSYAGFITCRVLLGSLEGVVTPASLVIISQWYKRSEQFSRTCLVFGFCGFGAIIVDLIGYGLVVRDENHTLPIAGWRLLFIIMGVITIFAAIVFWLHIPDSPPQAWFLSEKEKQLHIERIRDNQQGYGTKKFKWYQVKETLLDYNTWLHFIYALFSSLPNGGLTNFSVLLIQGLGFTDTKSSILMDLPGGGVMLVGCTLSAVVFHFYFTESRWIPAIFGSATTVMCMCLLAWGPNNASKLAGYFLWNWLSFVPYIAVISWVSSNSAGHTKKLWTGGIVLIGFCVGNLIGPQTFKASERPNYQTAKVVMAVSSIVCLVCQIWYVWLNFAENRRRDQKNEKLPAEVTDPIAADLTDRENPEFRYAL